MGRTTGTGRRRKLTQTEIEAAGQMRLLDLPKLDKLRAQFGGSERPIWTENKAKLVERYLFYFVQITHHGSYIDGFAGPQQLGSTENWCARRVIESEPKWIRHFFLCEYKAEPFARLEALRNAQLPVGKGKAARIIELFNDDFNEKVHVILKSPYLTEKEATFCLLDQRTFECHWGTVKALAQHKKSGAKIELFYFLATGWFHRAFASIKRRELIERWWGREDWNTLGKISDLDRVKILSGRMQVELGYKHATAYPIYKESDGGRIMYYMVHASDHDRAPELMSRAYRCAAYPKETQEQLELVFKEELGSGFLNKI